MDTSAKKISVVTSLYGTAKYVPNFYHQYLHCLKEIGLDYEFIFVDDGSPDNSASLVSELIKKDRKIKLVSLSRNFGQYPAMFAGIKHASGDLIFTSDSDLEELPENLLLFYQTFTQEKNIDFLYGIVEKRQAGLLQNLLSNAFYQMMNWISDVKLHRNMSWQTMMKKQYATALMQFQEAETLPVGIMVLTGFNQKSILIKKIYKGQSSYTLGNRFQLAINSITAFSAKPLIYIGLFGIVITALAFVLLLVTVIRELYYTDYQAGWVSVMVSIWFVGGLILSSVGVIGIYLSKIFNQVKNRPLYIVKSIIGGEIEKDSQSGS